jgi:hypothetical protein
MKMNRYDKIGIWFWVIMTISVLLVLSSIVYAEKTPEIIYESFSDNVKTVASSLTKT